MKEEKKGKKIYVEVSDYSNQLKTHGEYFLKKPKGAMFKYREARIILSLNKRV